LHNISKEVKSDDSTNREGFAAKIYWNNCSENKREMSMALFGKREVVLKDI